MDCPPRPSSWILSSPRPAPSHRPRLTPAAPACRARGGTPRLALKRLEGQRHAHFSEGPAQIHAGFCHAGLANRLRLLAPGDSVTLAEPHRRRRPAQRR